MSAVEEMSMISRTPPFRSDTSDPEDSAESPPDPPSIAHPSEESPLSPALSSWQDIISAIKLKFEGDMIPPSLENLHAESRSTLVSIKRKRVPSSDCPCSQCYRNPLVFSKRT